MTKSPPRQRPMLSLIPCSTCGALPTGEYNGGRNGDDQRKYTCGPHDPIDRAIASIVHEEQWQLVLAEAEAEYVRSFENVL